MISTKTLRDGKRLPWVHLINRTSCRVVLTKKLWKIVLSFSLNCLVWSQFEFPSQFESCSQIMSSLTVKSSSHFKFCCSSSFVTIRLLSQYKFGQQLSCHSIDFCHIENLVPIWVLLPFRFGCKTNFVIVWVSIQFEFYQSVIIVTIWCLS